ncbi:MAG: hypothetical protein AAFR04_16115 [Pseudomonadota bacterium]
MSIAMAQNDAAQTSTLENGAQTNADDARTATYLISYDLAEPATVRNILASEIMDLGEAWARPLASTWYVRTDEAPAAIESRLREHLDVDDGLLMQPVNDAALMLNTALRWFRKRRDDRRVDEASNVVAFQRVAQAA